MRRNNKALYELIMRNVAKEVKRTLNESYNIDNFFDLSMLIYRNWLKTSDALVDLLKKEGKLYQGMDFYEACEIIELDLRNKLDAKFDGDWERIGMQAGYTDEELNSIWVDNMQAKVDCIAGIDESEDEDDDDDYEYVETERDRIERSPEFKKVYEQENEELVNLEPNRTIISLLKQLGKSLRQINKRIKRITKKYTIVTRDDDTLFDSGLFTFADQHEALCTFPNIVRSLDNSYESFVLDGEEELVNTAAKSIMFAKKYGILYYLPLFTVCVDDDVNSDWLPKWYPKVIERLIEGFIKKYEKLKYGDNNQPNGILEYDGYIFFIYPEVKLTIEETFEEEIRLMDDWANFLEENLGTYINKYRKSKIK